MSTLNKTPFAPSSASIPKPKTLPLGYKWANGKVQIDPQQVERVREIFRQYIAEAK